ncbi:MAG: energy transducer TonB [Lentilitoribacter sp.]
MNFNAWPNVKLLGAVLASVGIHFAVAGVFTGDQDVKIEGAEQQQTLAFGNSFQDLVAGSDQPNTPVIEELDANTPEPMEPIVDNDTIKNVDPQQRQLDNVGPQDLTAKILTEPTQLARAQNKATITPLEPMQEAINITPDIQVLDVQPNSQQSSNVPFKTAYAILAKPSLEAVVPVLDAAPLTPEVVPQPKLSEVKPTEAKANEIAALDAIDEKPEIVTSLVQESVPIPQFRTDLEELPKRKKSNKASSTKKKKSKPEAIKKPNKKKPIKKTTKQKAPKKTVSSAKGNAKQNSKTGKASGKKSGKSSTTNKSKSKSKKAGNAAVSNYPGKVARKIKRTRHKRAGEKGKVRVSFTITASGGLSGLSIRTSSGSRKVDQAALDHIRRSAPFPTPPTGAKRKYVIPITIKN